MGQRQQLPAACASANRYSEVTRTHEISQDTRLASGLRPRCWVCSAHAAAAPAPCAHPHHHRPCALLACAGEWMYVTCTQ
eukprot:256844-Pelagomonas_calceolata.AAC.5